MKNYQKNGLTATVFDQVDTLVITNVVFINGYPAGVVSLGINTHSLI